MTIYSQAFGFRLINLRRDRRLVEIASKSINLIERHEIIASDKRPFQPVFPACVPFYHYIFFKIGRAFAIINAKTQFRFPLNWKI